LLESETLTGTEPPGSGFDEGFIGLGETSLIAEATITSHGANGGIFNFSIDDVTFDGPAAVPEPPAIALLGRSPDGRPSQR
jgi:hypothetical protein